jgi:RHS repeat-associated protein
MGIKDKKNLLKVNSMNMRSTKILLYGLLSIITVKSYCQVQPPAFTAGDADFTINWTKSKLFDQNGNVISETKSFFDYEGRGIQSQVKKKVVIGGTTYNHVFASQPVYDGLGSPVGSTLAAPINYADFKYQPNFATKNGQPYNYKNYDEYYNGVLLNTDKVENPDAVDNTSPGTLGWYYSANNNWEPYTATTGYPYSRTAFYKDGSGAVKKSAGVGDAFKMGSGREIKSSATISLGEGDEGIPQYPDFYFMVPSDLVYYQKAAGQYFGISGIGRGTKTMVEDVNEKKGLIYTDKQGKTIMSGQLNNGPSSQNFKKAYVSPYKYEVFINVNQTQTLKITKLSGGLDGQIVVQEQINYAGNLEGYALPGTIPLPNGAGSGAKIRAKTPFIISYEIIKSPGDQNPCPTCKVYENVQSPENGMAEGHYLKLTETTTIGLYRTDVSTNYYNSQPEDNIVFYDLENNNALIQPNWSVGAFGVSSARVTSMPAGYYRAVQVSGSPVSMNYAQRNAKDLSFMFYNSLGQLVASVPPEGVNKMRADIYNPSMFTLYNSYSYPTKADIPFISLFEYDLQGRLVKSTTPDGGMSELVYRKDGKIRFSQNAEQRTDGRYSYTHYDKFGRPVESGEFKPNTTGTLGIVFNADMTATTNPMRDILENTNADGGLPTTTGTRAFVTKTMYDKALVPSGYGNATSSGSYVQNFLRGGVSSTQKLDDGVNTTSQTWYSYDEQGRVTWTIQLINGFSNTQPPPTNPPANVFKTIDYEYDALGKVTRVIYQKQVASEKFSHHYEYNPDQTLYKVYTSTNTQDIAVPSQKSLQATYTYYLHGGLKRVELADKLQGIDYTYTLQGQLKAMNNADRPLDPGGDGLPGANSTVAPDVFGMTLDYYPNDYQSVSGNAVFKSINTTTIPGVANQYGGQIRNMSWHTRKNPGWPATISDAPRTYAFEYDDKYQFTQSTWGNPDFGTNSISASTFNQEIIKNPTTNAPAYDANGNMQFLKRTNTTGGVGDNFQYNYQPNTNKLTSINTYGTATNYAQYEYDNLGQLKKETPGPGPARYLQYDVKGLVIGVYSSATFTAANLIQSYTYDEKGQRISKYNKVTNLYTYYVSDQNGNTLAIYTRTGTTGAAALKEQPVYAADRVGIYYKTTNEYQYELKDHLGNVRAVIKKGATAGTTEILQMTDYYPYGYTIVTAGVNGYRFGYQGQYAEKDQLTGWNEFDLRMYDSRIGRWLSVDPDGQFYSPYIGMGNEPIKNTDPDGGWSTHTDDNGNVVAVYNDGDLGVYRHRAGTTLADIQKVYNAANTSAGGFKMGNTLMWNSFSLRDDPNRPTPAGRIDFGSIEGRLFLNDFERVINEHIGTNGQKRRWYAVHAGNGDAFDFKSWDIPEGATEAQINERMYRGSIISPEGIDLNDRVYASARDIGNFAAGAVARLTNQPKLEFMLIAGGFQLSGNDKWELVFRQAQWMLQAQQVGTPTYGEDAGSNHYQRLGFENIRTFSQFQQNQTRIWRD